MSLQYVTKRDGNEVEFDENKIRIAIRKANSEVEKKEQASEEDINTIIAEVNKKDTATVEEIQDIVEMQLMEMQKFVLSKAYMLYRYKRSLVRQQNTTDESILKLLQYDNKEVMEENSNKNAYIASTQRDLIAGEVSKDITTRLLLPEKIEKAHEEGILHFHDKDYFIQHIFNCMLINIKDMLDNGTVMNGKMIESPKSFQVACTVTTQIIAAVASSQYGGQSVNIKHLGKYLRRSRDKFRKKFKEACPELTEEQIEKLVKERTQTELEAGIQTIQYQINTLMTTNGFLVNGCCKIS